MINEVNIYLHNNNYYPYSGNYIKDVPSQLRITLQKRQWTENNNLIPFKDGVLNTKTNEFKESTTEKFLTWSLPDKYDQEVTKWTKINNWL